MCLVLKPYLSVMVLCVISRCEKMNSMYLLCRIAFATTDVCRIRQT
uniref:Uncharacterized protein LOC100177516 n=1 Tax=Phallusia mammillata TaxID=59560 RepID=A0A6F9DG02_9ASCI|nr:uncharacterized protein LOC100177516 [Phallusia mammillata]